MWENNSSETIVVPRGYLAAGGERETQFEKFHLKKQQLQQKKQQW